MSEEQIKTLALLEDELIHMMHDIEDTGKNKRIVHRLDKAISEIEIVLWEAHTKFSELEV